MKCPFQTITTEKLEEKTTKITGVVFADCLEDECPFYGKEVYRFNQRTLRKEKYLQPVCRRADNG